MKKTIIFFTSLLFLFSCSNSSDKNDNRITIKENLNYTHILNQDLINNPTVNEVFEDLESYMNDEYYNKATWISAINTTLTLTYFLEGETTKKSAKKIGSSIFSFVGDGIKGASNSLKGDAVNDNFNKLLVFQKTLNKKYQDSVTKALNELAKTYIGYKSIDAGSYEKLFNKKNTSPFSLNENLEEFFSEMLDSHKELVDNFLVLKRDVVFNKLDNQVIDTLISNIRKNELKNFNHTKNLKKFINSRNKLIEMRNMENFKNKFKNTVITMNEENIKEIELLFKTLNDYENKYLLALKESDKHKPIEVLLDFSETLLLTEESKSPKGKNDEEKRRMAREKKYSELFY